MAIRTTLKRIERAEKALKNLANPSPTIFKSLIWSEKTERLRRIGRQAFEAEVWEAAATLDGDTGSGPRPRNGESETWESERC